MRARSIEHVGSTAVPGLAAKPIIDIDVVVADQAGMAEAIAMLAALVAHLRLRDHLRANPGTAREYAALKRGLAAAYGDDRAGYTEAKTAFIEGVLAGG